MCLDDLGRARIGQRQCGTRLAKLPLARVGHTARLFGQGLRQPVLAGGHRFGQPRVPAAQAQQGKRRQAAAVLAKDLLGLGRALGHLARGGQRHVAAALHQRSEPQEMLVMVSGVLGLGSSN